MTIYVDVSEARAVSRLHPKLAKTAEKIVGLEAATGADILISTTEGVLPGNVNRPPGSILLPKHIQNGMLIQRKSGADMLNSIPHLHNIIARMRKANAKMSWLLITGYITRIPENGKIICEGLKTDWNWSAYQGAVDAWQILGGYVHAERDDLVAVDWIIKWDEKLPMLLKETEMGLEEKPITPKLGSIDPHPERVTLMSFPGIGDNTSLKIMDRFPSLAEAIEWMTQPYQKGDMYGIGEETIKSWRRWFGLQDGEVLSRFLLEGPTVHGESNEGASVRGAVGQSSDGRRIDFDGTTSIPNKPAARQPRKRADFDN